jgi:hypothetical protein
MTATNPVFTPSGHTLEGGVVIGDANARRGMVLFEGPNAPIVGSSRRSLDRSSRPP